MDLGEIYRPWLAIGVVALFGPQMAVKNLQGWSDRGLIEGVAEQKPGKYHPRLYSLANVIWVHGMNTAVRYGLRLPVATKIGQVCLNRLLERNDPDEMGKRSLRDLPTDTVFSFWVTGRAGKEVVKGAYLSPQDLANELVKTGIPAPAPLSMVLDVDGLIEKIWTQYHDLDASFNNLALEGRLKPFPNQLLLKGLYHDEC